MSTKCILVIFERLVCVGGVDVGNERGAEHLLAAADDYSVM